MIVLLLFSVFSKILVLKQYLSYYLTLLATFIRLLSTLLLYNQKLQLLYLNWQILANSLYRIVVVIIIDGNSNSGIDRLEKEYYSWFK